MAFLSTSAPNFAFMGGSMGSVVGEAITAFERAARRVSPIVISGAAKAPGWECLAHADGEDLRGARSTPG